jgi:hypothetical protein
MEDRVTCNADYLLHIVVMNTGNDPQAGVEIHTPQSQFRGTGIIGQSDALSFIKFPPLKSKNLGCIGAQGGETITIIGKPSGEFVSFLTVVTKTGAMVTMEGS